TMTSTVASPTTIRKTYDAMVLADGPAAFWRMDESSGNAMIDASGHGNDGAYAGAFSLGQPAPFTGDGNAAVSFDGHTGAATVQSSDRLQMNTITIELWIKKRSDTEYGVYVAKNMTPGGGANTGWFQLLNNHHTGRLEFRVTSDGDPALASASTLALNSWYYVVATYDGSVAKLFLNGKLDS